MNFFKCHFWNLHTSKRKESSLPTPNPDLHTKTKPYFSSKSRQKIEFGEDEIFGKRTYYLHLNRNNFLMNLSTYRSGSRRNFREGNLEGREAAHYRGFWYFGVQLCLSFFQTCIFLCLVFFSDLFPLMLYLWGTLVKAVVRNMFGALKLLSCLSS